ncbi:MAG: CRTAC1 family protein [Planctomycetota bacterium]
MAALSLIVTPGCEKNSDTPKEPRQPKESKGTWLRDKAADLGIDFVHEAGARGDFHLAEIMGGGVGLFDADGDGLLDVYMINGHANLPNPTGSSAHVNRLYRQLENGRFVDVTATSGLGDMGYGMGVSVGDIDNDGDLDVYVTNWGPDRLYANHDGTFEDITERSGVLGDGWSASASFVDVNGDGLLDLFVVRYVEVNDVKKCFDDLGRPDYCGPDSFYPVHDLLYLNKGNGVFVDASDAMGITKVPSPGLGIACADFDGDGSQDMYVANDMFPNQLWMLDEDGRMQDRGMVMGAALNRNGKAEAGMGIAAADFDGDTHVDLFLGHFRSETNTYYRNLGARRGFVDATGASGLGSPSLPYTGFGTCAFDLELDGDLDLLVVQASVIRQEKPIGDRSRAHWSGYAEPDHLFIHERKRRFKLDNSEETAEFRDRLEVSRGLAMGDLDNDGDIDWLIGQLAGPARLYYNDFPRQGRWLGIRAVDPRFNRDAVGAAVFVEHADGTRQTRVISSGGSYLSASDLRAHFGFGEGMEPAHVEVLWPDGLVERFLPTLERYQTLHRGSGTKVAGGQRTEP